MLTSVAHSLIGIKRGFNLPICAFFMVLITGCAQTSVNQADAGVNHIVLLWFKPDVTPGQMAEISHRTQQLERMGGIQQLYIGKAIASHRNIVDDSFDMGIYIRFDSIAAMNRYLAHPQHINLVNQYIKPNINRILVYDF